RLVGCYAYPFPTSPPPRFRLGSGLVGEAAKERKVITMRDIPDNYLSITSGLGEATPAQIVAVPCIYQEQVIGVMELASLEPFTTAQIHFITASMEFIASALNAAQIRTIIDALLIDTRHQTEDLLIQKEEQQQAVSELKQREADLLGREKRLREQQTKLDAKTAASKGSGSAVQGKMEASDAD
ncbi:MAG: GAF domain-containing protein, partial [Anaerolineales bacterium]